MTLLGIPGDNTYSNYKEAQSAFWRQTVLPLVARTAKALSRWLSPAWERPGPDGAALELRADLDSVEALTGEREALWARLNAAGFLTNDEKRAAEGYAPIDGAPDALGPTPDAIPQDRDLPMLPAFDLPGLKYRPDQPRAPRGRADGGEWVDAGGGGGGVGRDDDRVLSDATPDDFTSPGTRLAGGDPLAGYPVDLREEEQLGGHAIEKHVRMSQERLTERVRSDAKRIIDQGDEFEGLAIGSFSSLEAATKLVNSTISRNADVVDLVVNGTKSDAMLSGQFDSVTGYEVFLPTYHSEPYFRETYGVRVFIVRDGKSKKGYRLQSAFPRR